MSEPQADLAPSTNYLLAIDAREWALAARIARDCLRDCPDRVHAIWYARLWHACEGLVSNGELQPDEVECATDSFSKKERRLT